MRKIYPYFVLSFILLTIGNNTFCQGRNRAQQTNILNQLIADSYLKTIYSDLHYSLGYKYCSREYAIRKNVRGTHTLIRYAPRVVVYNGNDTLSVRDTYCYCPENKEFPFGQFTIKEYLPIKIDLICSDLLKNLTDEELRQIMLVSNSPKLKIAAIKSARNIKDEFWQIILISIMKLERPYESFLPADQGAAIELLEPDSLQLYLSKLAIHSQHESVRSAAISKLDSEKWQEIIAEIGIDRRYGDLTRRAAIMKFNNQTKLELCVRILKDPYLDNITKHRVLNNLDPVSCDELLSEVIYDTLVPFHFRERAIKEINSDESQELLAKVSSDTLLEYKLRYIAVKELDATAFQELLIDIAVEENPDSYLGCLFMKNVYLRIKDDNILAEIYSTSENHCWSDIIMSISDIKLLKMLRKNELSSIKKKKIKERIMYFR